MKPAFLILLYCITIHKGSSQNRDEELLRWTENRKLTWEDYKAAPDTTGTFAASTTTYLTVDYTFTQDEFAFKIHSDFSKTHSWGLNKTAYILQHEQGHFDIAEIFARKLYKCIKEYRYNKKTCREDLSKIYDSIVNEKSQMQEDYDRETNHSIIKQKQKEWLKKIDDMLVEYRPWAGY